MVILYISSYGHGNKTLRGCCIGAGGVLRDSNGNWISGFAASLGNGSVLDAEAWGLLLGLKMTYTFQCTSLLIESDSNVIVQMLKKGVDDLHPLYSVLGRCKFLMDKLSMCDVSHVHREINMVANSL